MKNCGDWEREMAGESEVAGLEEHFETCERCREYSEELEKNSAALRELTLPPAAFAAVRERVLSGIEAKRRRTMWWTWSAAAAAACAAILFLALVPRNPAGPGPIVAKMNPPKIEWTPRTSVHRVHSASSGRLVAKAAPARKTEPLVAIKMLTDDPNVIIIWLVDQKGDSL